MISKRSGAAALLLLAAGCGDVKPQVAQFGAATLTAKTAEASLVEALNQKKLAALNNQFVADARASKLDKEKGTYDLKPLAIDANSLAVRPEAAANINALLDPVQKYGEAMASIATDNAPATFAANIENLQTQASSLGKALAKAGVKGAPNLPAETAKAVGDLGKIVIEAAISRDVQRAAAQTSEPLSKIVGALEDINNEITRPKLQVQEAELFNSTAGKMLVRPEKYPMSYGDVLAIKAGLEKSMILIRPDEANAALHKMLDANRKIAEVGPKDALEEIQLFLRAANDAYVVYSNFAK